MGASSSRNDCFKNEHILLKPHSWLSSPSACSFLPQVHRQLLINHHAAGLLQRLFYVYGRQLAAGILGRWEKSRAPAVGLRAALVKPHVQALGEAAGLPRPHQTTRESPVSPGSDIFFLFLFLNFYLFERQGYREREKSSIC